MATNGKMVAVALVGVGALAAFTMGGTAHASETEPTKPKAKVPAAKVSRVTLAAKYARIYGVPTSLVLASIAVGKMSLATGKDIYPKAKAKLGKAWDGTAEGLRDDAISIGLSAYYLSLWWKRYRKNPRQWILSGYAYILGPGRVRRVLPNDAGTLPKPLPADFVRVKTAFAKAMTRTEVKNALKGEGNTPALGADILVGKKLAATIPATTTGYQARALFGKMTGLVSNAYVTLSRYDASGLAQGTKLDAGSVKAARDYLNNTNATLKKYYAFMPESSAQLTAKQLEQLRLSVSTSSVAVDYIDKNFGTSFLSELATSIKDAGVAIVKKAADTVGMDKTGMAIAAAGIIGVAVLVLAVKK
jgi:hypothetical protein